MKKISLICLCILLVSVNCFAEFVISPKIGYSNIFSLNPGETQNLTFFHKNSLNTFAVSADMGYIGNKGFTFLFNNNFSFLGSINKKMTFNNADIDINFKKIKGAYWNGELLLGYTFKQPMVYCTLATGFGAGTALNMSPESVEFNGNSVNIKDFFSIESFNAGLALHISAAYYFTKNIGISFSLTDTLGFGIFNYLIRVKNAGAIYSVIGDNNLNGSGGFSNVFYLKVGPVFKF